MRIVFKICTPPPLRHYASRIRTGRTTCAAHRRGIINAMERVTTIRANVNRTSVTQNMHLPCPPEETPTIHLSITPPTNSTGAHATNLHFAEVHRKLDELKLLVARQQIMLEKQEEMLNILLSDRGIGFQERESVGDDADYQSGSMGMEGESYADEGEFSGSSRAADENSVAGSAELAAPPLQSAVKIEPHASEGYPSAPTMVPRPMLAGAISPPPSTSRHDGNLIKVNPLISQAVRHTYRSLSQDGKFQWNFREGVSSPHNQLVIKSIISEIRRMDGVPTHWPDGALHRACSVYWRTQRDRQVRLSKGTNNSHRKSVRRNELLSRKLKNRMESLQNIHWPTERKILLAAVLNKDYMSSEESDEDINEVTDELGRPCRWRRVRSFSWESEDLRKCKEELDSFFLNHLCSQRQLSSRARVTRPSECLSSRPLPSDAPPWCIRQCAPMDFRRSSV